MLPYLSRRSVAKFYTFFIFSPPILTTLLRLCSYTMSVFNNARNTMNERSYVGIDKTDKNEWIVVLWCDGKSLFSRPYGNTPAEFDALARFITERCDRPKICLNPTTPQRIRSSETYQRYRWRRSSVDVECRAKAAFGLAAKRINTACIPSALTPRLSTGLLCRTHDLIMPLVEDSLTVNREIKS